MRKTFTLLCLILLTRSVSAQISTQGTDFWVGMMYNLVSSSTSSVSISAKDACSGTITNPTTGYSASFSVAANGVTTVTIPNQHIVSSVNESKQHFAVHIQTTDTVSVFGLSKATASSDASFYVPTSALGSTYMSINWNSTFGQETVIIGVEDSTEVDITPTKNTTIGMVAGTTYRIKLYQGETYMFTSNMDMTGTLIKTVDPCGKIAVVSGATCANVPLGCQACDHIFEMLLPVETWGKSFFCTPLRNKITDYFRVIAANNSTSVTLGSVTKTLNAGQFFDTFITGKPLAVSANNAIAVMGYVAGSACSGNWGDPDMYWVPPVEQNLFNLQFSTVQLTGIDSEYVNIVVKTTDTAFVKLNGSKISRSFTVDASYPNYAYAQCWLSTNVNSLVCEKGFIATVYGSGRSYDSYAYSAGTSAEKLNNTQYIINGVTRNIRDTLNLCKGKPYQFASFKPGTLVWSFNGTDTIQRETPKYAFQSAGYYTITSYPLQAYCLSIIQDTLVIHVKVNDICMVVNPTPDTLVCQGNGVKLNARGTTQVLENCRRHDWYRGSVYIGRGTPVVTPTVTTQYRLISTDSCTSTKDTAYLTVKVRDPIAAKLNNDTTLCKGRSIRLSATITGGDSTYIYTWINGLNGSGFLDSLVTPPVTTTYSLKVEDGCTVKPDTASITVNVRPELTIQPPADTTICTQGTAILRPVGIGGDSSYVYQWKHNGAFSDTLALTVDTTTTMEIWLSDACTVKPDTGFVTVYVRPNPQIGVSHDTTICIGGVASMQAWGLYGDSSYVITWKGMGTGANAFANPIVTTTYEVMVEDQCSAENDTAWIKVNVRPALDVVVRPDTTICTGQSADLWVKGRGGDSTYTYSWDNGLGSTALENVIPAATTTYRIILGDACTVKPDTAYTNVYVRPPLGLTANNDTVICIGQSVKLTAVGSGGDSSYTYSWNQGLGNGATHTVTPNVTTTYTVTLDDNCSPVIQEQVTVTIEGNPTINFTANPTDVCFGDSVWFTNNTAGNYTYLWRFGDKTTSTDNNPAHLYGKPGQYNVTLVAISSLLCRDSMTMPAMVQVYPNPVAAYTANPPATSLLNPLISFKNNSQLANLYQWDFGDLTGASDKNPKHTYLDTGWYDVSLIVTGANSCTDTAFGRVRINDYFKLFIPNSFTPNGDNTNELFEVKGRGIIQYHISIYNRWGEIVFESDSMTLSWDGKMPGQTKPSPDGQYYYVIELLDVNKQKQQFDGQITLLK